MLTPSTYPKTETKEDLTRSEPIRPLPSEPIPKLFLQTTTKQKLRQLGSMTLIQPKTESKVNMAKYQIQNLNNTFHWQVAQINALLNTILVNNVVTKNDTQQLKKYRETLEELRNQLQQMEKEGLLTSKQLKQALSLVQQAQETIHESQDFVADLKDYNAEGENFDRACDELIDMSYDPKSGDPLISIDSLKNSVISLSEMSRIVQPLLEEGETIAASKLLDLFSNDVRHFSWIVEDWSESIERACKTLLKDLSKLDNPHEKIQQYEALSRHLQNMQQEIKKIKKDLRNLKFDENKIIQDAFDSISSSLDSTQKTLASAQSQTTEKLRELQKQNPSEEFAHISYGDSTWTKLASKHPSRQPPSWLSKKIEDITNIQEWSDGTREVVYRLFILMQLDPVSKISGAYNILSGEYRTNLKKMADVLQEKAFRDIPPKTIERIEYETATLGTLLMFNYKSIQHPKTLEQLTHKCPSIRSTLQAAIDEFGTATPDQEQIREIVDSFRVERLLKESPFTSPYYQKIFSSAPPSEKTKEMPPQTDDKASALQVVEEIQEESVTSDASKPQGFISSIFKGLGAIPTALGWSAEIQEAKVPPATFVSIIQQETHDSLMQSARKLENIEKQLNAMQEYDPEITLLRRETKQVHRELFRAISNAPSLTCEWIPLANWTQHSNDQCNVIELLEEKIEATEKKILSKKKDTAALKVNPASVVDEIDKISLLSHAWELRGVTQDIRRNVDPWELAEYFDRDFYSTRHELEGMSKNTAINYIRHSLHSFTSTYPNILSKHEEVSILNALADTPTFHPRDLYIEKYHQRPEESLPLLFYRRMFDSSLPLSPNPETLDSIMFKIKSNEPALIPTGWPEHAVSFVIQGNYLMYCNRGEGSILPILVYKINPKKITKDILLEFYWESADAFFKNVHRTFDKLDIHKDRLCLAIERLNPIRPHQITGNCVWESQETAVFGILALQRLLALEKEEHGRIKEADQEQADEQLSDFNKLEILRQHEVIEQAYYDFQAWLQFTKISILESYLATHVKDSEYIINPELLQAIFRKDLEEKAKELSPQGKSNAQILNELSKQLIPQTYDDFLIEREEIFKKFAWKQDLEKKFDSIKEQRFSKFPEEFKMLLTKSEWTDLARFFGEIFTIMFISKRIFSKIQQFFRPI